MSDKISLSIEEKEIELNMQLCPMISKTKIDPHLRAESHIDEHEKLLPRLSKRIVGDLLDVHQFVNESKSKARQSAHGKRVIGKR